MPGVERSGTTEETSTITLDQSVVDNVSIKTFGEKTPLKPTVDVENTLTVTDMVDHQSLDDIINNSLSQEIDLIHCSSSTSKYTMCEENISGFKLAQDDYAPSYSQSETDLTKLKKRKLGSPDPSENARLKLRRFANPKLKRVSFHLQNTPD